MVEGVFLQYESKLGLLRKMPHIVVYQVDLGKKPNMKVGNAHWDCCAGCTKMLRKLQLRLQPRNLPLSKHQTPGHLVARKLETRSEVGKYVERAKLVAVSH